MQVGEYIAELLLNNEQVIIPGFGAITSGYQPAAIHPVQHSFQPPAKKFSFNPSITGSDRVLEKIILERENLTEEAVNTWIAGFTDEINSSLKEKGSYSLKGIGKFYYDVEKKLQFTSHPDKNYLLPSFGLPDFISKPVLHPENIPSYSSAPKKEEKKKRRLIWFRFK
jgi:nucleoid DNA-binding protein